MCIYSGFARKGLKAHCGAPATCHVLICSALGSHLHVLLCKVTSLDSKRKLKCHIEAAATAQIFFLFPAKLTTTSDPSELASDHPRHSGEEQGDRQHRVGQRTRLYPPALAQLLSILVALAVPRGQV